jgi:hypothetical protein
VWPNEGCVMRKNWKSRSGRARASFKVASGLGIGDVMPTFRLLLRLTMTYST